MENRKGSGVFLGVIGVATLIVAIIGATFAYFSATTPGNIRNLAGAASLSLGYADKTDGLNEAMIPVYDNIALYSVEYAENSVARKVGEITGDDNIHAPVDGQNGQCYDDAGNEICSYFEFTIYNPSKTTTQNIQSYLTVITNGLPDLYFRIYDERWKPVKLADADDPLTAYNDIYIGNFPEPEEADDPETDADETKPTVALPGLSRVLLPSNSDTPIADGVAAVTKTDAEGNTVQNTDGSNQQNKYTFYMIVWIQETKADQTDTHEDGIFASSITFTSGTDVNNGVTGVIAMGSNQTTNNTSDDNSWTVPDPAS